MEYINTHKCTTNNLVITLLLITSSCVNITLFGYHHVFDERINLQFFYMMHSISGLGKEAGNEY